MNIEPAEATLLGERSRGSLGTLVVVEERFGIESLSNLGSTLVMLGVPFLAGFAIAAISGTNVSSLWFWLPGLVTAIGLLIVITGAIKRPKLEGPGAKPGSPSWKELNRIRVARYQENAGLFLVHSWTPSDREDQVADVTVHLAQHNRGPLTEGVIEAVEYVFGPQFQEHSTVVREPKGGFEYATSMYGTMLCVAKVYFSDGRSPLVLERYIDFDDNGELPRSEF